MAVSRPSCRSAMLSWLFPACAVCFTESAVASQPTSAGVTALLAASWHGAHDLGSTLPILFSNYFSRNFRQARC